MSKKTEKTTIIDRFKKIRFCNDFQEVKTLFNAENVNEKDQSGVTALHVAAKWGKTVLIPYLIEIGSNLEAVTSLGSLTPIQYIFQSEKIDDNHIKTAEILIKMGADINVKNKMNETLLWYAVDKKSIPFIEMLIANKIDIHNQDDDGETIFGFISQLKESNFKNEITELLMYAQSHELDSITDNSINSKEIHNYDHIKALNDETNIFDDIIDIAKISGGLTDHFDSF